MGAFPELDLSDYHCLTYQPRRIRLLDKPHGFTSGISKDNLAHQMRYSVGVLERDLKKSGTPHVLQLVLEGENPKSPSFWELRADGIVVAEGTGEFAHECFVRHERRFLCVCRDAVAAAKLPEWNEREYRLLSAARDIAALQDAPAGQ